MNNQYQTVILTFSDGTVGHFTGQAVIDPENSKNLTVVNFQFTEPRDLPPDMHFEILPEAK